VGLFREDRAGISKHRSQATDGVYPDEPTWVKIKNQYMQALDRDERFEAKGVGAH
jgi:hypothetical protein